MDVVVTLAKSFGLDQWIAEGDPAGAPWSGQEWDWWFNGGWPPTRLMPGERVYVVYDGRLRGYAPLVRINSRMSRIVGVIEVGVRAHWSLVRGGGAVAMTIPERIPSFRGFRYRWWPREIEHPFPEWRTP